MAEKLVLLDGHSLCMYRAFLRALPTPMTAPDGTYTTPRCTAL